MQPSAFGRSWAIYVVSGILLLLTLSFGAFFVVWCATLSFIFQIGNPIGLILFIFSGLITWLGFKALKDAWQGLPEAPAEAAGALGTLLVLILISYGYGLSSGELRTWFDGGSINWVLLALPLGLILGAIGLVYWLSPHFQGHLIETDSVIIEEPFGTQTSHDDDEWMHLGGA